MSKKKQKRNQQQKKRADIDPIKYFSNVLKRGYIKDFPRYVENLDKYCIELCPYSVDINTNLVQTALQRASKLQDFFNSSEECQKVAQFACDPTIMKIQMNERTYLAHDTLDKARVMGQNLHLSRKNAKALLVYKVCNQYANECLGTDCCVFTGVHHHCQEEHTPPIYRLIAFIPKKHENLTMLHIKHGDEYIRGLKELPDECIFIDFIIQSDTTWRLDVGKMELWDQTHIEYVFRPDEQTLNVALDLHPTVTDETIKNHISLCKYSQSFFSKIYQKPDFVMSLVDWKDGILEVCFE